MNIVSLMTLLAITLILIRFTSLAYFDQFAQARVHLNIMVFFELIAKYIYILL